MRNEYDLLKVLAILLVVMGHCTNHYSQALPVTSGIYLFHIPLFVALSGSIFQYGCEGGKYVRFYPFLAIKARRLLLPLLFVATVFLAPVLVLLGMSECGYCQTVMQILKGGCYTKHLWYLQAIFLMFINGWVINRLKMERMIALVLAVVLSLICSVIGLKIEYFSFSMCISCFPYFVLGMVLYMLRKRCYYHLLIFAMVLFCVSLGLRALGGVDFVSTWFSRLCLRFGCVVLLYSLARLALRYSSCMDGCLAWVLRYSFPIYLFHMSIIYGVRFFGEHFVGWWVMIPVEFLAAIMGSFVLARMVHWLRMEFIIGEKAL